MQQVVAFGLHPCSDQAGHWSEAGEGHASVLALGSWRPVPVDFPSTPGLPFVQLLVVALLIQEGAGVWTALSWQLLSGLHLVTQGEESLLVLAWLMD